MTMADVPCTLRTPTFEPAVSEKTSMTIDYKENKSPLLGFVDNYFYGFIIGWALDLNNIEAPLDVEILANNQVAGRTKANHARNDLMEVFESRDHGFAIYVGDLLIDNHTDINVRIAGTDHILPWTDGIRREMNDFYPQETPTGVFGIIESLSPFDVRGWAWSSEPTALPIYIDVYLEGSLIAQARANLTCEELPVPFNHCGFNIELPPHTSERFMEIKCVARTEGSSHQLVQIDTSASNVRGAFRVVDGARVEGWALRSEDGSAARLDVLCDGNIVWHGDACRRIAGREIGFRVDLPNPTDWSKPRNISVLLGAEGRQLAPDVTYVPKERFVGHLDAASLNEGILTVRGWVCDSARRLDSLKVAIEHDGRLLARGVAAESREDVFATGIGARRCGFTLRTSWPQAASPSPLRLVVLDHSRPVNLDIECEVTTTTTVESSPAPAKTAPLAIGANECIWSGSVDTILYDRISGWVRSDLRPNDPVLLDLYIDGSYYYSNFSGKHRADVGRKFSDHGNHGFHFELPPHLITDKDRLIKVMPRYGKVSFANEKVLRKGIAGRTLNVVPISKGVNLNKSIPASDTLPKVAYIMLNFNGAALLTHWFDTFERHNRYDRYEILVIDHGSTDNSLDLCQEWSAKLPVRTFPRGRNYSFSESNNFASENTNADILVFVNNDIVFTTDVACELVRVLADDAIGMVGIKLFDAPIDDMLSPPPVQHLGVHFNMLDRKNLIEPFETRYGPHLREVVHDIYDVPVVTGALMACRRETFETVGGFDEGYYYGYEDVDLCLRLLLGQGKRVVSANTVGAVHMRGFSRGKSGPSLAQRLINNKSRLHEQFGKRLRRRQARDRFERPGFWSSVAPRIAFAVTEASENAVAGDYYTALELALELVKTLTCQIVFLDKDNWFDVQGVDVLITMVDNYDLRNIKNAAPHLLRIGWARNWIDRWAVREWAQDYDAMWASSRLATEYLSRTLARPVELIQIATNPVRFQHGKPRADLASDYCFTGNYFAAPREIIYHLDPDALPFDFALFGSGWEEVPTLAPYCRGRISYQEMPDVYASTRIVIDDANSVTKEWGSVNSRVFDAIAAGALVITNGKIGADELFGGLLPTYTTTQELEAHLRHFLTDENSRRERVAALQAVVVGQHAYSIRAEIVQRSLRALSAEQLRFGIKIGAPRDAVRNEWGDYHFAVGLKHALTRLGHTVRIDCVDRWEGAHTLGDDVVLVLRGLSAYEPKPHQLNLMWIISHPDTVARGEYERYDHVFVASTLYAAELEGTVAVPVTPLLQCTDPELFNPDVEPLEDAPGLLFVGNSRNIYRQIVRDAIDMALPVEVYGSRWENFVPSGAIKGGYIPNQDLARYYLSATWVLNDHWDDMRRWGFISNRLFDAVAAGARVVSDEIAGLSEVFGDGVFTYRTKEELGALLGSERDRVAEEAGMRTLSERIRRDHSFDARVSTILGIVANHLDMRLEQTITRHGSQAMAGS